MHFSKVSHSFFPNDDPKRTIFESGNSVLLTLVLIYDPIVFTIAVFTLLGQFFIPFWTRNHHMGTLSVKYTSFRATSVIYTSLFLACLILIGAVWIGHSLLIQAGSFAESVMHIHFKIKPNYSHVVVFFFQASFCHPLFSSDDQFFLSLQMGRKSIFLQPLLTAKLFLINCGKSHFCQGSLPKQILSLLRANSCTFCANELSWLSMPHGRSLLFPCCHRFRSSRLYHCWYHLLEPHLNATQDCCQAHLHSS